MTSSPPPKGDRSPARALLLAVLSALAAGILVAVGDVAFTLAGADYLTAGAVLQFAAVTVSLYAVAALATGLAEGVVAAAVRSTHPGGLGRLWRHLRSDPDYDREALAVAAAALAGAAVLASAAAILSLALVGDVERKGAGAMLVGLAVAGLLPVSAAAAYPVYRLARRVTPLAPRLGPVPATVLVLGLALVAGIGGAAAFVMARLDWRVLPLEIPVTAAAFLAVQGAALAAHGAWRRRRPKRGLRPGPALVAASAAVLVAGAGALLLSPSERAGSLLSREGNGIRTLVGAARRLGDRDGDGYAGLLRGGDCDDSNPRVHPGARDIPGNGIDENCLGGDAPLRPAGTASAKPKAAGRLRFGGNVVIIAVDTLRADRLGAAGYRRDGRSLTPHIDELAGAGVYFSSVYSQAPNTPRSFPSIFLSRFPSQVKWDKPFANYSRVLPENVSLFEALRGAGFRTVGVSSHFYFTDERGITQGFDEYDNDGALTIAESNTDVAAPRILPRVKAHLKTLAAGDQKFALFIHFFEPHSRYVTHPQFPIHRRGIPGLKEKYDYEIAFVDRFVGEVRDVLQAQGLDENTMVVLLSDHGEGFGEHRFGGRKMFFHGQTLYDVLLRVPLIFYIPGQAHRVVSSRVMLVDVAPTILDLLGVAAPKEFCGHSLVPDLLGDPPKPETIYAELLPAPSWNHSARMLIDGDKKIIYWMSENVVELYDLAADPGEKKNLAHADPALVQQMKAKLADAMDRLGP